MATAQAPDHTISPEERKVIFASSLGTVFEWYDFYLLIFLTDFMGPQFLAKTDDSTRTILLLLLFAAGFVVRPFGAVVFGRLGDLVGRKYTFLVTILIMGLSTFCVGLLPTYESIGISAPIILVILRILQGLALGGEYGGAATYVAEHAPDHKRGSFTSWIQTTATLGLVLSLMVILGTKTAIGDEAMNAWGWRIPFLVSVFLLGISVWIRLSMNESPAFKKMKEEGKTSKAPLKEAFGQWKNLKIILLSLVGLIAGQAVVWYTGQLYAYLFLVKTLKVDTTTAQLLLSAAMLFATPFFIFFGALSDKIGRKKIILAGCVIAVVTYMPIFKALTHYANPALEAAQMSAPVVVVADPNECQFQFNPTGTKKFTSSCDIAKAKLVAASVNYQNEAAPAGTIASIKIGDKVLESYSAQGLSKDEAKAKDTEFSGKVKEMIKEAGYPAKADPAQINQLMVFVLLFVMVVYVTMVYGPIAAMLVEMFPTRIRYSSMSLPYHVGNGWFGGLLPATVFAMVALKGDMYYGLWYPIVIAAVTAVVGTLFIKETKDNDIYSDE